MPSFDTEHKRILQMAYPEAHDEYSEVLTSLGEFLDKRVAPLSSGIDAGEVGISEPRKQLLDQGMCKIPFPEKYGGLGLPFGVYSSAVELLGAADASVALSIEIHNAVSEGLFRFGNDGQKSKYLPDLLSGKKLASFSLTEPTSGSDARGMATKASRTRDGFSISGSKTFITNAGEADLYLVFAKTNEGPSSFLVESGTPGLKFGKNMEKLGMRGSKTAEVHFDRCEVPEENLVGEDGKGVDYAKQILHSARIVVAALNVGIAQVAYNKALGFSKQRKAFGQPISDFQLIRSKVADMKTSIMAGRLLYVYASRLKESGAEYSSEASQAKVFATEMSLKVCDEAIQIHGGLGYTTGDVHRHWRDARLLTIGEGTSEVLRMLIARRELAKSL